MKKFLNLLFAIIPFIILTSEDSCGKPIRESPQASGKLNIDKITQIVKPDSTGGGTLRFINIDEHDYIMWYSDKGVSICHNEHCSNEIHKH